MNSDTLVPIVIAILGVVGGGFGVKWLDRKDKKTENHEENKAELKKIAAESEAQMRAELRGDVERMERKLDQVQSQEETYRIKYWEEVGAKAACQSELAALRPRFIETVQENQVLLAKVSSLTAQLEKRRREDDENKETLQSIKEGVDNAAVAAQKVAEELAESQGRADKIDGEPGAAADAASKSQED